MGEMVERVALALSGSDDPTNILEIHRLRARAAIAVMREPTAAMLTAADAVGIDRDPSEYWPAMIDEALK